jgi:hypothetical protein
VNYEHILNIEDKRLSVLLSRYKGRHLLQLSKHTLSSLASSPIPHKIQIYNSVQNANFYSPHCAVLQSAYTDLPFASESISLALLPHTLEVGHAEAKLILHEAWRVLAPNAHLILMGINPLSLWGCYLPFSKKRGLWTGYWHMMQTICQWILALNGKICHIESFFFRPPLSSRPGTWLFNQLVWLEKISPWLFPYQGGIYLIIAQKQVPQMTSLRLAWQWPPVLGKTLAPNPGGVHRAENA